MSTPTDPVPPEQEPEPQPEQAAGHQFGPDPSHIQGQDTEDIRNTAPVAESAPVPHHEPASEAVPPDESKFALTAEPAEDLNTTAASHLTEIHETLPEQPAVETPPGLDMQAGFADTQAGFSETQPVFVTTQPSFFEQYARRFAPPRFPNMLDLLLLGILLAIGGLAAGGLTAFAFHAHWFGVTTAQQALEDIHYTLGSQAIWYLITFGAAVLLFPAVWHTGFFKGVEWNASAALRMRWRLASAVVACFAFAMIDGLLIPGPTDAPIDKIFRLPGAAWALFAFGTTLAPFFEELGFRGFLLPSLCTAYDWAVEHLQHRPAPWPDSDGKTQWSMPAMVVGSILTSIPFALIHAQQTGYSIGPFVLLICVSLALCWVRLSTRSLAASTVVHACYNLLLFVLMLVGTGGFRHLDRM